MGGWGSGKLGAGEGGVGVRVGSSVGAGVGELMTGEVVLD